MANTANLDSVFDNNTESELDFDTIFGEIEDSIIDTVNGVDNDGNSLLTTPEIMKEMEEFMNEGIEGEIETPANSDAEGTEKTDMNGNAIEDDSEFKKANDIATPANSDAEGTRKTDMKGEAIEKDSEFKKADDIATPANSDAEGTDKPDMDGKALVDKEEKANESADPDSYLLEEEDAEAAPEVDENGEEITESADPDSYLLEEDEMQAEVDAAEEPLISDAPEDEGCSKKEAADISTTIGKDNDKAATEACNCGKPECKICNPVSSGSEGTTKTDIDGEALVDKEEEKQDTVDLDDSLVDESFFDTDDYLLEESDLEGEEMGEEDEDYASEELGMDEDVEEGCKKEDVDMSAAPLFGIEPKNESDEVDPAEDEIIDAVDDNDATSADLDYDADIDEEIIDSLL